MPPVINSSYTTLTEETRSLFVDITGAATRDIENALAIVCVTLQAAGFSLERVGISGAGNRTPQLPTREVAIDPDIPNRRIGLRMDAGEMARCLRRSRLDASIQDGVIRCTVPPYRFDIFGPMDIVEEVALGYGVDNMEPTLPVMRTVGRPSDVSAAARCVDRIMTGLGFTEAVNSSLTGRDVMDRAGHNEIPGITVANPKSQSHTTLRHRIVPGLLENLSRNIHEPYPHRLYEAGVVFRRTTKDSVAESMHLGCVMAHPAASYSEAKSVLQTVLQSGMAINMKTPSMDEAPFQQGRAAAVMVDGSRIGGIGEVSGEVRRAFRIRDGIMVAAFEIDISGLIFDG